MKHLEFIEEMRIDNLIFFIPLVLMPLLRFRVRLLKQCWESKAEFVDSCSWLTVRPHRSHKAAPCLSFPFLRINTA